MRLRVGLGVSAAVIALVAICVELRSAAPQKADIHPAVADAGSTLAPRAALEDENEDRGPTLRPPTGKLASLSCAAAATIVKEVRGALAFAPVSPPVVEFAATTKDWLDPHGHWAVAADSAPFATVDEEAAELLAEISRGTSCVAALRVGQKLAAWVDGQRARFDARAASANGDAHHALTDALDVSNHADASTKLESAALTDELGERAGVLNHAYGPTLAKYVQFARDRFFPRMTPEAWSEVVLAAAVRAWVEQVDVHGAWAPYGEEATVHDVDLDQDAPTRLWARATRTILGVRIDEGALPPLANGDVLLDVNGMALAGLPVEQLDELALTAADVGDAFDVVLVRGDESEPRIVRVDLDEAPDAPVTAQASTHPFDLTTETIPYGSGQVAVVTIPDVYDDLGELFTRALVRSRTASLVGIVLDLRGNGGGSTEGAIETLGAFLPGARLFPMRNRSGAVEVDRAPTPPADEQWTGPVATFVDGGTASAAEMLAGALAAYRRGPSVGAPTYGKGCAQEYVDDDAHAGLLRVTTLLFSLPDGSPVQRVGLTPSIAFPFRASDVTEDDREAKLERSPSAWTGPDVRDRVWLGKTSQFAWPSAAGHVGPCKDDQVCKAIALLGDTHVRGPTASRASEVRK